MRRGHPGLPECAVPQPAELEVDVYHAWFASPRAVAREPAAGSSLVGFTVEGRKGLGPTGAGKSTLLLNLITQDMRAGYGLVVLDPKGDLIADCLDRVPNHRANDVIHLDPTDDDRPVGLNPIDAFDERN